MRIASLLLTASAAALTLAGQSAARQDGAPAGEPSPVYLDADTLIDEGGGEVYTARGDVRLTSGARVLLADELVYDRRTGRITARGDVRIYEGDAPAQTADELVLDDALEEGVAYGFATLLENNGKAAAAAALRRPGGRTELRDAYYTACDLCEDGSETPTWRLRAREVVRDTEDDMIRYRGMALEVEGVPVFYTPYFAHADPAAARKSGFLMPSVDISDRLGLSYQQPYFWAISPYQDLVIAPRIMTEANPILELEWARRFYSGQVNVETSFTYEQDYTDPDNPIDSPQADPRWTGDYEFRGHVFADGRFNMAANWDWGFGVQAVSDPLYLRRYDYSEQPDETSALFDFDQRTLINQLFVVGRGAGYYTDLSTVGFSRLNEDADDDRQPLIAPLLRFHGDLGVPERLGDLDLRVNAVNINRQIGDDYARASVGLDWSRPAILPGGVRAEAFALGRADAYHYNVTDADGVVQDTDTFTRAVGAAGVDISWPFLRTGDRFDTVVAPRVFTVAASGLSDDQRPLPAETEAFDLDRSTLFRADRTGGYDVWEDGVRMDAGLEAVLEGHGRGAPHVSAFLGRSLRLDGGGEVVAGPSVAQDESDWVAELGAGVSAADFMARGRFDSETGEVRRLDLTGMVNLWRVSVSATYTEITEPRDFEELQAAAAVELTDRWSAFYDVRRDISRQETRQTRAGIRYLDECTDLRIFYERTAFQIADLGPDESIRFELVLFTLGGVGAE